MPDKKLTDAEIVKALECCFIHPNCPDCPLRNPLSMECMKVANVQAVDLINRQKAEIERLQKHNTEYARKHYQDGKTEAVKEFVSLIKAENGNRFMKEGRDGADVFYEFDQEAFDKFVDECVEKVIGETDEN